jgi:acetolactate synthase-1/2/3 large subunit
MGADKASGLSFPNYKAIANAHGMIYKKIINHRNLKEDVNKILQLKKTVICELIMSPNEEQIPKAVNRRDPATGKSMPAKLEDMYPFLSKDELSSNNLD